MSRNAGTMDLLYRTVTEGVEKGVLQLHTEDDYYDGRKIVIKGQELLHFGSCSYLGLELDDRIKQATVDAVMRYGAQFSSSRTFLSATPYAELEELLAQLFGGHVIMTPTTTLGHFSSLPTIIEREDAIILDQQVHNSIQMAANQVRVKGTHIETVRHSRMDLLEKRLEKLSKTHRRIWYLIDGVYSMFGDIAPFDELQSLLQRYEQLHLYVDDAHGMSWAGKHGRGVALANMQLHERMVLATSLCKAFGCGGGVLVFPNAEMEKKVRACGGPMIFSGPVQPPMLGAGLASARIHLSDEIVGLQAKLQERIQYCNDLMEQYGLPLVSPSDVPIRYVAVGKPSVAHNMVHRLYEAGFYTNPATYPAVPVNRSGIRFTITTHHTLDDLRRLTECIATHLPHVLAQEGGSLEEIYKEFNRSGTTYFRQKQAAHS